MERYAAAYKALAQALDQLRAIDQALEAEDMPTLGRAITSTEAATRAVERARIAAVTVTRDAG